MFFVILNINFDVGEKNGNLLLWKPGLLYIWISIRFSSQ
jgi:hypothetical protein